MFAITAGALVLWCACTCRAATASGWLNPAAPIAFTNQVAAFNNGRTILTAIKSAAAMDKKQIGALVGSRVMFHAMGGGFEPHSKLKLEDNVVLEVEADPLIHWEAAIWAVERISSGNCCCGLAAKSESAPRKQVWGDANYTDLCRHRIIPRGPSVSVPSC